MPPSFEIKHVHYTALDPAKVPQPACFKVYKDGTLIAVVREPFDIPLIGCPSSVSGRFWGSRRGRRRRGGGPRQEDCRRNDERQDGPQRLGDGQAHDPGRTPSPRRDCGASTRTPGATSCRPSGSHVHRAKQFLYPSEFLALVSSRDVPTRWKVNVVIAVYLGIRDGEQRALLGKHVDLEHGVVNV
jgi:hypothetical protein